MSTAMNHGAASPDEVLRYPAPYSLCDVLGMMDRLDIWLRDDYGPHGHLEYDGEVFTYQNMLEDLQRAADEVRRAKERLK